VLRLDPQAPALDQVEERIPVARQAEEPVALDDPLRCLAVLRAEAVVQVAGHDERLAAGAVEARVVPLVQIASRGARRPEPLDAGAMPRIGARPDEVVVRQLQERGEIVEPLGLLRHELRHRQTRGQRGVDVLERVVVGAAEETHVAASQPAMARKHVRLDELQRVAKMWIAVHVGDGGGDVRAPVAAHRFLLSGPAGPATDEHVGPASSRAVGRRFR
jgi:hypothetical protein